MEDELYNKFTKRTKNHIKLVNKYAHKVGLQFPNHDGDKLTLLSNGYKYYSKPKEERTEEEQKALDDATLIHITTNPHHPESWTNDDLSGFTRKNFTPNGPIDATSMMEPYISELCADWCAVSEEMGNTPFEWFEKVNGKRWLFSEEQQKLILETLHKMWK